MKKWMKTLLLSLSTAALLCGTAFAADEIEVQVNDKPIAFTDVQPLAKDGRTYIPMRATFNALGFADENIAWNGATSTVTATRDELTISLKLGEKKITVTEAGVSTVIETDAAAFAQNNRTYVPVRFVAEAAGCNVGWDAADRIVLIDDIPALLAANTETYALMNEYLEYSKSMGTHVLTEGSMSAILVDEGLVSVAMDGSFDAIVKDLAMEMNMAFDIDIDAVDPVEPVQMEMPIDIALRGDLENGKMYFKSDALSEAMGVSNAWFLLDMGAMMNDPAMTTLMGGIDYNALLELSMQMQEMTFEEYLAMILGSMPLTDDAATAGETLAVLNALLADSAFTKEGSDYICSFEQDGAAMTFLLTTKGGKVNGCEIVLTAGDAMGMDIGMQDKNMSMQMIFSDGEGVYMELVMEAVYKSTTKTPAVAPPADAAVIDLMGLAAAGA